MDEHPLSGVSSLLKIALFVAHCLYFVTHFWLYNCAFLSLLVVGSFFETVSNVRDTSRKTVRTLIFCVLLHPDVPDVH